MTVAQFLGHRVHGMTGRHAHLTAEQRKRAIEKVPHLTKPSQVSKKSSQKRGAEPESKRAV